MQAVVKMPHISITIEADKIPSNLLTLLKDEYGSNLKVLKKRNSTKENSLTAEETDWYKQVKSKIKPSDNLKIYRANSKLSQGKLAKKIGVLPTHISEMERGKRGISKQIAKKLAVLFDISIEKFI